MPAADLPSLEHRLEACVIELDELQRKRPHLPDALARAGAGQRIDELLDEIAELQQEITLSPAVTLRRLAAWIDGANETPERLLASALGAVERAVERA